MGIGENEFASLPKQAVKSLRIISLPLIAGCYLFPSNQINVCMLTNIKTIESQP